MPSTKHRIEYFFFKSFQLFFFFLPPKAVSYCGYLFGHLCYFTGIRKQVILQNLNIAFEDSLDHKDKAALVRQIYRHFGAMFFEFMKMRFIKPVDIPKFIKIEGIELIEEAKKKNTGVILAGCHMGNWELLSAGTSILIEPIHGYAGLQKNRLVDDEINRIRQRFGMNTISKSKQSPKYMLKALKSNSILAIGGDLNVPHTTLFVDFFGKKAAAGPGQATFVKKQNTPFLFFWSKRVGPFKYKAFIEPIVCTFSGDSQQDIQHIAQCYSDALERAIRNNPDQYFWFNRRWKTRPKGEKDLYS